MRESQRGGPIQKTSAQRNLGPASFHPFFSLNLLQGPMWVIFQGTTLLAERKNTSLGSQDQEWT